MLFERMVEIGLIFERVVQSFVAVVCLLWVGFDGICIISELRWFCLWWMIWCCGF